MNTGNFDEQMRQLQAQNKSAKTRMILGIVFIALGVITEFIPFIMIYTARRGNSIMMSVIMSFIAFAFFGVGTPLLITGIVGMAKSNRAMARLRMQQNGTAPQQFYQPYQQPVYQQQPAAPQQPYQQPANPQPDYRQNTVGSTGAAALDWQKYQPLDAGISYDPSRNYQFHRAEGFVGSMPQSFVNRTFPKCPLCCSPEPYWTISQHNQMSWKGNLYLFKCSHCDGIISMSMPDVTTLSNGGGGVATNPTVGLTNLMVKANSGKQAGVVYGVIESVGRSGVDPACQGKEFKLEDFQQMFLRA